MRTLLGDRPRLFMLALPIVVALFFSDAMALAVQSVILYDGALKTLPDAQGWTYLFRRGTPKREQTTIASILDTTSQNSIAAGYFADREGYFVSTAPVPELDRQRGFSVTFRLRVETEAHTASDDNGDGLDDRAGFCVIVVTSDLRAIELAFWQDHVWAQEGGTGANLFTQAEGVSFDTTAAMTEYRVAVQGDEYTLSAKGKPLFHGPLRDYSAFNGFPDPYEVPSLLFFGDNTTRANSRVALASVMVGDIALPGEGPPQSVLLPWMRK